MHHISALLCIGLLLVVLCTTRINAQPQLVSCDVVIAGGSTSAFAAAIASAASGAITCLLEPTDWVGGQMTSSGVSAIDFAWHHITDPKSNFTLDVSAIDHEEVNQATGFWKAIHSFNSTAVCWVSTNCYLPQLLLQYGLYPLQKTVGNNLKVYLQTVVKSVGKSGRQIQNITGIQRTPAPKTPCNGYDIFPSHDLADWYSVVNSTRWLKTSYVFTGKVFMDATDWGELLPLSGASYLQGIDEAYDGDTRGTFGNDTCGQAFTYSFAEKYNSSPVNEPPNPYKVDYPSHYPHGYATNWNQTWTYRRLLSQDSWAPKPNDITLQNTDGNDFPYQYIFLSKAVTSTTIHNWQGGVSLQAMDGAERLAYGWHYYYKSQNETLKNNIALDPPTFGTCHGLAKMPYIRDSRRSIGINDFVIKIVDITGTAEQMVGNIFPDRLAVGSYDVDIHAGVGCKYPTYMQNLGQYQVMPYYIPFRAMTNRDFDNMLVAGKSLAQSFLVNAASRLHPIEWASGSAAGAAAAFMANNKINSTTVALQNIDKIRAISEKFTPSQWTINGKLYPPV